MSEENKYLVFIAGGSGAGKGFGERKLLDQGVLSEGAERFSGYSLLKYNPKYRELRYLHRHPEKVDEALGKQYYELLQTKSANAIRDGKEIIIDDHLDNLVVANRIIARAKKAGYTTILMGFSASPEAVFSSHNLSGDYKWMLESHQHFASAYDVIIPQFDLATVIYREKDEGGKAVCVWDKESGETEILDGAKYEKFRHWQNANVDAKSAEDVLPQAGAEKYRDSPGRDRARYASRDGRAESFVGRMKETLRDIKIE